MKQWHPDKNPDRIEEATARFQEIRNAHDILSDPDERYRYDVKKAIDDILDEDETAFPPMWHITEQLTAKFPNITPPGFEDARMQVMIDPRETRSRQKAPTLSRQSQYFTAKRFPPRRAGAVGR